MQIAPASKHLSASNTWLFRTCPPGAPKTHQKTPRIRAYQSQPPANPTNTTATAEAANTQNPSINPHHNQRNAPFKSAKRPKQTPKAQHTSKKDATQQASCNNQNPQNKPKTEKQPKASAKCQRYNNTPTHTPIATNKKTKQETQTSITAAAREQTV
jgi:hypothetical protein